MSAGRRTIVNPGPADHPLRKWIVGDEDARFSLQHLVSWTGALPVLSRLHHGEELDDHDRALLGVLNFQAYLQTYEPVVALMPDRVVRLHPSVLEICPEIATAPTPR